MSSDQKSAQVGFRLYLADGKIVEAEHLVMALDKNSLTGNPDNPNLKKHRPARLLKVPYEYADSHGGLIYIAKSYHDAMDNNNGLLAPFASDSERRLTRCWCLHAVTSSFQWGISAQTIL